jgi:hypothetical protein
MSPNVSCGCFSSPRSDVDEMDFTRPILPHCPILIIYIYIYILKYLYLFPFFF